MKAHCCVDPEHQEQGLKTGIGGQERGPDTLGKRYAGRITSYCNIKIIRRLACGATIISLHGRAFMDFLLGRVVLYKNEADTYQTDML